MIASTGCSRKLRSVIQSGPQFWKMFGGRRQTWMSCWEHWRTHLNVIIRIRNGVMAALELRRCWLGTANLRGGGDVVDAQYGTKHNPRQFESLFEAMKCAKQVQEKVWATIAGEDGAYEIYPGGRTVFWPNRRKREE